MASKPVAKTMASSSKVWPPSVRRPVAVISAIGSLRTSTRRDVVAVVGLVVVGIEAEPLGADRMVLGRQQFAGALVLHDGADLVAHELRGGVVRLLVHQQVGVGIEVADAAAFLPLRLVGLVALVFRQHRAPTWSAWDGRAMANGVSAAAARRAGYSALCLLLALGLHRPVARRQAEVGGALEDRQVLGLAGDDRDHLHARRAGADHADAQAAEVDTLMRPQAGVVPLALEVLQALEVGHARRREVARRHDAVARADLLAAVGLQRPFARLAVEQSPRRCAC